jgi:hypothetical protein
VFGLDFIREIKARLPEFEKPQKPAKVAASPVTQRAPRRTTALQCDDATFAEGGMHCRCIVAHLTGEWPTTPGPWKVSCPAHPRSSNTPSLDVRVGRNGRPVLFDHGKHCALHQIVEAGGLAEAGLWPDLDPAWRTEFDKLPADARAVGSATAAQTNEQRTGKAARMFLRNRRDAVGTQTERYLDARGIGSLIISNAIAHAPRMWNAETETFLPAMLAMMCAMDGDFRGTHRTFLNPDGTPTKAKLIEPKKTYGPVMGSAIHLTPPARAMIIAEGVETAWSGLLMVLREFDIKEPIGCWATITSGNMGDPPPHKPNDPRFELPPLPYGELVFICVDMEPSGQQAAAELKARLEKQGRTVELLAPTHGKDMNDSWRWIMNQKEGVT